MAFVTGASYGIGAATALGLARDGFDVAVSELRPEHLADTVAGIGKAGARGVGVALDVRSLASIRQALAEVVAAFGRLDVLVNNAGVPLTRPALEVTEAEWDEVVGVNLRGAFFTSQQMGRHLIESGRAGAIVSIASTHGVIGVPDRSTYGISKAGIVQMTRMLAIEWAPHRIRVNAVAPATVETPSRAVAFAANPGRREFLIERIPLRRFGTAEEMADAVCYLASDRAAYITGQTLLVDGGLTAY
ncbi:MAG TPA: SDR family NAD(P)-dependent oxidoreductase [Methylomirabilota bacterium]|nr:SDR family NAD(P)-dependent oxidoreductase [Methylomirabilota bacterium]